jgi:hypothetical protein
MIRKSGSRFSEKIMLHQNARARSLQSEAISLYYIAATLTRAAPL